MRGFLTWKDTVREGAKAGYVGAFMGGLFGILTGVGIANLLVHRINNSLASV